MKKFAIDTLITVTYNLDALIAGAVESLKETQQELESLRIIDDIGDENDIAALEEMVTTGLQHLTALRDLAAYRAIAERRD